MSRIDLLINFLSYSCIRYIRYVDILLLDKILSITLAQPLCRFGAGNKFKILT